MKRRKVLQGIALGSPLALSGCTGLLSDEVELLGVAVYNTYNEERRVDVRLEEGDDRIVDEEYTLPPDEPGIGLDCEWSDEPGDYTLAARLDGADEWVERSLTDGDSDCAVGLVRVTFHRGEVAIDTIDSCDPPGDTCG